MIESPYYWAEEAKRRLDIIERDSTGDTIEIVLSSDENFLKYTAVTIATILKTYRDVRPLRIHLLTNQPLSTEDRRNFDFLRSLHPVTIVEVPVNGIVYDGLRTTPGISTATYFRLQMHELLPPDVNKVVYLDSDIVVKDCVSKLYDIELGSAAIAGVEDTISNDYVIKLGQHPDTVHINAGVILVDVDAMRKIRFTELSQSFMKARRYTMMLGDQEIITGIFGLVTYKAPVKWNVHGSMFEPNWVEEYAGIKNKMDAFEARSAIELPSLIHYTFKRKPWIAQDHPRANDWRVLARMTPYRFELGL